MDVSSPVRILVVDDEPSVRLLLRRWIERSFDAEVSEAQDGLQALEKVAEGGVEVLISDINMPVLNGIDMLTLLQTDPARENMEMLIVSQVASEEKVQQVIALGVSDYLLKPLQYDWVIRRLQAAADRVRARRDASEGDQTRSKTAVLVADSDPNFCAFAEASLSGRYHVETARSIAETLVKTLRGRPDVILLSTGLPGLSIDFALERIAAISKADPPQVYLLGDDGDSGEHEGVAGRLSRTFVPETLRKSLANALSGGDAPARGMAAWSDFLAAELVSATRQTFGMMTGEEPETVESGEDPPPEGVYGWIAIRSDAGEFEMRVDLVCAIDLAGALMGAMLGEELPPEEEPPLDALQEVLNVVAGRVKNSCLERHIPVTIGLPEVGRESLPEFDAPHLTIRRRFRWSKLLLDLTLIGRPAQEDHDGAD